MRKIAIWGTGKVCNDFIKLIDLKNNQIVAFIDNNTDKIGECIKGEFGSVSIVSPDSINKGNYDLLIICSSFYYDILIQCNNMNLNNCIPSKNKEYLLKKYKNLFTNEGIVSICLDKFAMIEDTNKTTQELLWRDIFCDTVKGCSWYDVKSISLGRWAVGYNYLYVLIRILEVLKPNEILELGLGQSSKVLSSYFKNNKCEGFYDIVEQDKEWISFFIQENQLNNIENITIHNRNINTISYEGSDVFVYEKFDSVVNNKRYSLISIDGPWGSDGHSRIDLLNYIPQILQDDFVIIIDDYNRDGEKTMVSLMIKAMEINNIPYCKGIYPGLKDVCIIVSTNYGFLTSL